jgi:hypothetical protein
MSFFKVDKTPVSTNKPEYILTVKKLKYVIGKDGKGYWIKPTLPFDNNYDRELPF